MSEIDPFRNTEVTVSASPLPEGLGEEYGGRWVALRGRRVIAAAESHEELVSSELFNPETDATYFVPEPGVKYFYYAA